LLYCDCFITFFGGKKFRINERFRKRDQKIQKRCKDGQPADKKKRKKKKKSFLKSNILKVPRS
jgi:hypothetical protein